MPRSSRLPFRSSSTHRMKASPTLLLVLIATASLAVRADVAVLREKGPFSGTAFANPGLMRGSAADAKVSMRSADVQIRLSRGPNDTLVAKCEAVFELADNANPTSTPQDILVAFPVSGLSS